MEKLEDYLTLDGWKKDWDKTIIPRIGNYVQSRINLDSECEKLVETYPKEQVKDYKQIVLNRVGMKTIDEYMNKNILDFVIFPTIDKFSSSPVIRKNNLTNGNDIAGFNISARGWYQNVKPDIFLSEKYGNLPEPPSKIRLDEIRGLLINKSK